VKDGKIAHLAVFMNTKSSPKPSANGRRLRRNDSRSRRPSDDGLIMVVLTSRFARAAEMPDAAATAVRAVLAAQVEAWNRGTSKPTWQGTGNRRISCSSRMATRRALATDARALSHAVSGSGKQMGTLDSRRWTSDPGPARALAVAAGVSRCRTARS